MVDGALRWRGHQTALRTPCLDFAVPAIIPQGTTTPSHLSRTSAQPSTYLARCILHWNRVLAGSFTARSRNSLDPDREPSADPGASTALVKNVPDRSPLATVTSVVVVVIVIATIGSTAVLAVGG
jgi:hypothetical protein